MAGIQVNLKLQGLAAFRKACAEAADAPAGGPLRDAWTQVAVRYRAFIQERYSEYSRGGGNWAPLAESTIRKRTNAPVTRLHTAIRQGLRLTAAQYAKRLKAARAKAARHWNKHLSGEARFSILIDTGILFAATSPVFTNAPGQYEEEVPGGIIVGFGGPEAHPDGGPTIADIASFHQTGGGTLPQRKIIVPPAQVVKDDMVKYLERGLKRMMKS